MQVIFDSHRGHSYSHSHRVLPYTYLVTLRVLNAFSHLYKRVCPSVRPSVTHELKPWKSAVFDKNYYQYEREYILCRVSGSVYVFTSCYSVHSLHARLRIHTRLNHELTSSFASPESDFFRALSTHIYWLYN